MNVVQGPDKLSRQSSVPDHFVEASGLAKGFWDMHGARKFV